MGQGADLPREGNGNAITYDTVGNPLNDGTWTYTWEHGRELSGMYGEDVEGGMNDITIGFMYNADGLRTGKTVTTRTYELAHVHSYTTTVVAPTCTEAGYTLHECECGGSYQDNETAALGHSYSDPSSMICTRCGYDRSHTHSYTETVVAPTCTEGGYTLHECECGGSYQDNETAALGHYYSTPSSLICTRCGYNRGESTEQTGQVGLGALEAMEVLETSDDAERVLASTVVKAYAYIYNGSSLSQMTVATTVDGGTAANETLYFAYDASGTPMSVTYNGTNYYYATNLQGDVTAILNTSGTAVVGYDYDAWGNILTTTGSMASTLGTLNPLRYRGYVYDTETGLYYLQSRYYNPEIGRFINADASAATGQGLLGNNMFAYCNNNPVNLIDSNGQAPLEVALYLLVHWVFGGGKNLIFNSDSLVSEALKNSKTMQTIIGEEIAKYENGEEYGKGSVKFAYNEPDLWLGIRNADYEMTIEKETKTTGFWIWKRTKTRYVVNIKVSDTYNFNAGNERGDGLGSILNNIGYWAQENNLGKQYLWEANYVYETK